MKTSNEIGANILCFLWICGGIFALLMWAIGNVFVLYQASLLLGEAVGLVLYACVFFLEALFIGVAEEMWKEAIKE
jgi:hypothetical protein